MITPTTHIIFGAFICAAALATKGQFKEFMDIFARNMIAVFLVGIGFIAAFMPSASLLMLAWFGFNLLSTITNGQVRTFSVICELIFLVYWCIPVIGA